MKLLNFNVKIDGIKNPRLFIACIILAFVLACKKDKNDSSFISATINGTDQSFRIDVGAAKGSGSATQLFMLGSSQADAIAFALSDTTVGEYSEINTTGKILINAQFVTLQGLHFSVKDSTDPCKLTITNINPRYVEGHFSGTLVGQSRKKMTNGKFKIYFD